MIRVFKDLEGYNTYTNNGQNLVSGDLYWVKGEKSAFFLTNNIDGEVKKYDMMDEIPEGYIKPEGNIAINANGEGFDVNNYATASVSVPIPEGYIIPSGNKEITANGENIDVNNYATASVNVPQPTGNISITENGENIDIAQYATATVNVPSGTEDLKNVIERDITSITIPSGTTIIGNRVFQDCGSLTSVTIPSGVTSIGENAFNNCGSLTSVTIPSGVTSIGQYAFAVCNQLTSITIPNSVTSIGNYAFQNCSSLTSVTIPSGVTSIGQYAFRNCTGLTSITIGNGVTTIGNYAFQNCTSLTSVTVEATTPPSLGSNAFANTNDCPIYVPGDSLEAYRAAANWSSLGLRINPYYGDVEAGGTDNELYTIADTVVDGEPGARITANNGQFVGYYNSEEDAYYDTAANLIDMAEYQFDFGVYLDIVYGIE